MKVPGLYITTYKWRFSNHFSVASYSVAIKYDTFKMTIILIATTSRIWNLTYLGMWPSATQLSNPYKGLFCPGSVQFDSWVGAQIYMSQQLLRQMRHIMLSNFNHTPMHKELIWEFILGLLCRKYYRGVGVVCYK